MEYVQKFDGAVNQLMGKVYKRPAMVSALVHMLIILYATKLAPELPESVLQVANNPYAKLFVFSLILWTAKASPSTSILIALAFMITMNYANSRPLWEFLDNVSGYDATDVINAPSKQAAVTFAVDSVNAQTEAPTVVSNVVQKDQTVYITPSIVQTEQGPTVVNPSVVVTPVIVSDTNGKQYVIQPDMTLIQHSFVPEKSTAAVALAEQPKMAVTDVNTMSALEIPPDATGCYPSRTIDMLQVTGVSKDDYPYPEYKA